MAPTPKVTPTELSRSTGISLPYASQVLSGARTPSRATAIRIWRRTGLKLGPIRLATDADLEVLERLEESGSAGAHP